MERFYGPQLQNKRIQGNGNLNSSYLIIIIHGINSIIYQQVAIKMQNFPAGPQLNTISPALVQKKKHKKCKRWTAEQNRIYAKFLKESKSFFASQKTRRKAKVFVRLSKLLQTKSIGQCKSHHQKMLKFCGDIPSIILRYFRQPYPSTSLPQSCPAKQEAKQDYPACRQLGTTIVIFNKVEVKAEVKREESGELIHLADVKLETD